MNISEKALQFAIKAHEGQTRRNEPDKPVIIHPIGVAEILREYGADDNVIAAGYLHDIVEDTDYTIEDIRELFGPDIASLVSSATEPDKTLPWEDRKAHTILNSRNLQLRHKRVICADKINNLESLMILFGKTGVRDFSYFNRGEADQRWYYTNVYKSLVAHEDPNLPMFVRLKNAIDVVFNNKEDTFLKYYVYNLNLGYFRELKKLNMAGIELAQFKSYVDIGKPFMIEFSGTPRTGKTSTINSLYDYFKKIGLKTSVVEEFTTSDQYKKVVKPQLDKLSLEEKNVAIIDYAYNELIKANAEDNDVVLLDRSINDRMVWNNIRRNKKEMSQKVFDELREKYGIAAKSLVDYLVLTYADPITAIRRDYNNSLSLAPRSFLNVENISDFNHSVEEMKEFFKEYSNNVHIIDTTDITTRDTALDVATSVVPLIRTRYLERFKSKYK